MTKSLEETAEVDDRAHNHGLSDHRLWFASTVNVDFLLQVEAINCKPVSSVNSSPVQTLFEADPTIFSCKKVVKAFSLP